MKQIGRKKQRIELMVCGLSFQDQKNLVFIQKKYVGQSVIFVQQSVISGFFFSFLFLYFSFLLFFFSFFLFLFFFFFFFF